MVVPLFSLVLLAVRVCARVYMQVCMYICVYRKAVLAHCLDLRMRLLTT